MRKGLGVFAALAVVCGTGGALAQDSNADRDAARGAAAGQNALGAVGAFVGGVTGAAVGGAKDIAGAVSDPATHTVKRKTCITYADGSRRCDSVETTE